MTFAEYIEAIEKNNTIFCIEEHCDGRFVGMHLLFGYIEVEEDEPMYGFYHYQENSHSQTSYLDPDQEVKFRESSPGVTVKDTDGNVVELVFYTASPIPNPS